MQNIDHYKNAVAVIDVEISALEYGKRNITDKFGLVVELVKRTIHENGRVAVTGMGKSGHVGKKIAATLASTGTPAFFVHPAEAGHGDLGMITKRDVVLAISQSGKSEEINRLIPFFKRHGVKIVALTGDSESPLGQHSDFIISTAVPKEACPLGLAPTASTTLTLALGDALAISLLQAFGFTEEKFAETHPHGMLGRKLLTTLKDVMTSLDKAPIVEPSQSLKDSIYAMTRGEMGFVIVVEDGGIPIGVFTDGDLRRCIDRDVNLRSSSVADVMNKEFISIEVNQLAVKAVDLMGRNKVSALPVVCDRGLLVGAINMRQLLQAGVV